MKLNDIKKDTPEGRLLWAALIVLTTSPSLKISGEMIRGSALHPDEMLAKLEDLAQLEEKLSTEPKPWPEDPASNAANLTGRLLG